MTVEADRMRSRVGELRRLADEIERTPLMTLELLAGPDTWQSPAADDCRDEIGRDQLRLHHAADDLRWSAYCLEREADELDAAARMVGS